MWYGHLASCQPRFFVLSNAFIDFDNWWSSKPNHFDDWFLGTFYLNSIAIQCRKNVKSDGQMVYFTRIMRWNVHFLSAVSITMKSILQTNNWMIKANNTYVVWVVVNSQYCTVNRIFPGQTSNHWRPCHRDTVFLSSHHCC